MGDLLAFCFVFILGEGGHKGTKTLSFFHSPYRIEGIRLLTCHGPVFPLRLQAPEKSSLCPCANLTECQRREAVAPCLTPPELNTEHLPKRGLHAIVDIKQ